MRLIDADELKSMYSINRANFNTVVGIQKWIDDAPTVQAVPIDVLDKIRAEITEIDFDFGDYYDHTDEIIEKILQVIDKYNEHPLGYNPWQE